MTKTQAPTPDQLRAVLDALAHHELLAHIAELKQRVVHLEQVPHLDADEAVAREHAAVEVDTLAESIARIHAATAGAIANASPQVKAALHGIELAKMADDLRCVARWLREPTPEANAAVERFVAQLQSLTGVPEPWPDRKAQEELAAEIEADVNRSLEEIFGDNVDMWRHHRKVL